MNKEWPNGKRLAITVGVMLELWTEGKAPQYGPNTSSLKPGTLDHARIDWSHYGAREGVWRLKGILDRHDVPATFWPSGRVLELYPEAIRAIDRSPAGHTLGGHSYTQDSILSQMSPEDERAVVKRCVDLFQGLLGRRPEGWSCPLVSYTPHTAGILAEQGFRWHVDIYDADLPRKVSTPHGVIVGIPNTNYSDNRVLHGSPLDLFETHRQTFDYLRENEPGAMMSLVFHCHTGGRPLVAAMLDKLLGYFKQFPDVWFARHGELAQWALDKDVTDPTAYASHRNT